MGLLYTHRDHLIVCVPLSPIQRRVPILHHIDREGEMVLPPPLLIHTLGHSTSPLSYIILVVDICPSFQQHLPMERCPLAEAQRRAVHPYLYTT